MASVHTFARLSGGLGNQFFQLNACLFAVRSLFSDNFSLDCRFLSGYETARDFEIDFILRHLPGNHAYSGFSGFPALASRLRFGRLFDSTIGPCAFISSTSKLQKLKRKSLKWVILDGYFQDPAILLPDTDRLSLFGKLANEFSYLPGVLALGVSQSLVSIHIRRGDFVTSKSASNVFNTVSLDYYRTAIRSFPSDVTFLVFGDDPLVTSHFAAEIGGVDMASRGLALKEEFMLMSLCDHHIIANSTFSWWAAHLGYHPAKRVISPRDWYVDPERSKSNTLLLPHFELLPAA